MKGDGQRLRVLVVLYHQLIREGLVALLSKSTAIQTVAHTQRVSEAVEMVGREQPDVIICGYHPLELNPCDLAQRLERELGLQIPIVVVSGYLEKEFLAKCLASSPYIRGYIVPNTDVNTLVKTLIAAQLGLTVFDTHTRKMLGSGQGWESHDVVAPTEAPALTARQREVLKLLLQGLANKEIASQMSIGLRTVEMHIAGIKAKMGARSRVEVVTKALQQGKPLSDELPPSQEPGTFPNLERSRTKVKVA